jgi:hypothetical protein
MERPHPVGPGQGRETTTDDTDNDTRPGIPAVNLTVEEAILELTRRVRKFTPDVVARRLMIPIDEAEKSIRPMISDGILEMVWHEIWVFPDGLRPVYDVQVPREGWTPSNEICPQCLADSRGHALKPACRDWHHRDTDSAGEVMPPPADAEYRFHDADLGDICLGCAGTGDVIPAGLPWDSSWNPRPEPGSWQSGYYKARRLKLEETIARMRREHGSGSTTRPEGRTGAPMPSPVSPETPESQPGGQP